MLHYAGRKEQWEKRVTFLLSLPFAQGSEQMLGHTCLAPKQRKKQAKKYRSLETKTDVCKQKWRLCEFLP